MLTRLLRIYKNALKINSFVRDGRTLDPKWIESRINMLIDGKKHPEKKRIREAFQKMSGNWNSKTVEKDSVTIYVMNNDLYAAFGNTQEIATLLEVKLPIAMTQKLKDLSKKSKINMTLDIPFFLWFNKDIAGITKPESTTKSLYYLDDLLKKSNFKALDMILTEYIKIAKTR